jgi:hypothetical protein
LAGAVSVVGAVCVEAIWVGDGGVTRAMVSVGMMVALLEQWFLLAAFGPLVVKAVGCGVVEAVGGCSNLVYWPCSCCFWNVGVTLSELLVLELLV